MNKIVFIRNQDGHVHAVDQTEIITNQRVYDSAFIKSGSHLYNLCKGLCVEIVEGVNKTRKYPNGLTRNQANHIFNKWIGKKYKPNPGGKRGPKPKPKFTLSDSQILKISELSRNGRFSSIQDAVDAVIASGVACFGEH